MAFVGFCHNVIIDKLTALGLRRSFAHGRTCLIVEMDDGVATVTLNRPDARNALSAALQVELNAAITDLDVRADVAFARALDYRRTAAPSRAHEVWYVTETGSFVEQLQRVRGASVVASTTPLRAQQEAELSRLQGRLWAEIRQIGRPDLLVFLDNPFLVFKVAGLPGIDVAAAARAVLIERNSATGILLPEHTS